MTNQENTFLDQFEEENAEDTLSFSNLPFGINGDESPRHSSYQEELFEFFNGFDIENIPATTPYSLFFGKLIDQDEEKEHQIAKNSSTLKQSGSIARIRGSYQNTKLTVSNVQNVNITSLTSMSNKSKRKMFMFGPVKFMPEMELSSIKQRQGKLPLITPVKSHVVGSGEKAVSGGGKAVKSRWGLLLRSLKSRSNVATIFSRSFGCIPVTGVDRWIVD